jgi:hypothetical protein
VCLILEALELTEGELVFVVVTLLVTELPLSLCPVMELSSDELRVEAILFRKRTFRLITCV